MQTIDDDMMREARRRKSGRRARAVAAIGERLTSSCGQLEAALARPSCAALWNAAPPARQSARG